MGGEAGRAGSTERHEGGDVTPRGRYGEPDGGEYTVCMLVSVFVCFVFD